MWQQWVNFILGLWIVLSAYLGFTGGGLMTNMTVVGLLVAIFAVWGAVAHTSVDQHEHRHA